ncbi:MAG TPA: L,D-transpeptidase family protein [Candidatus Limnocylindria bacterium]|nr:L,D-transpeptidase family protein [Candidatus Limnocylindria bacterium]
MSIARVTEIIASSNTSFEDAVEKATSTARLRHPLSHWSIKYLICFQVSRLFWLCRGHLTHYPLVAFITLLLVSGPAAGTSLDRQTIDDAQWHSKILQASGISSAVVKAQVLLDRARFSPGEIDGRMGENFRKALTAFAVENELQTSGELTEPVWQKLVAVSSDPVLKEYTISKGDVKGPFAERIPAKMEDKADLPALAYISPRERLAEKFHMSEELLAVLNPGQKFDSFGDTIVIANVRNGNLPGKVARIEVDKSAQTLRAFGRDKRLLAFYPITAGSAENPAPSGRLKVTGVSKNPTYRYNPDYAFKGVKTQKPFTINSGPNNPVGLVWIGLAPGEGYGIHGTPEPSKVSKTESHGCIRMTNWDALELASALAKGTPVDFIGDERTQP